MQIAAQARQYRQKLIKHSAKLGAAAAQTARQRRIQLLAIAAILLSGSAVFAFSGNQTPAKAQTAPVHSFTLTPVEGVHTMESNSDNQAQPNASVQVNTSSGADTSSTTSNNSVSISAGSSGADVVVNGKHVSVPPNGSFHTSSSTSSDSDDATSIDSSSTHVVTGTSSDDNSTSIHVNVSQNSSSSSGGSD